MAIKRIKALYQLEQQWKSLPESEKKAQRNLYSQPLLEEFKTWLLAQVNAALPKSTLGNAMYYTLNNWEALYRYGTTGLLNIDNNLAEQSMRPSLWAVKTICLWVLKQQEAMQRYSMA